MAKRYPSGDAGPMVDATRDQLSLQLGFIDAVDTKIGVFLSIGSALLVILVGVVVVQTNGLHLWGARGVVGSGLCYGVLATVSLIGIWGRSWKAEIDDKRFYADHFDHPTEAMWRLAETYSYQYAYNRPKFNLKVLLMQVAATALVLQTVTLALALGLIRAGV